MDWNKEMEEFYDWSCLVRRDKITRTARNTKGLQNCRDLLCRLRHDPENIKRFLTDDPQNKSHPESREFKMGKLWYLDPLIYNIFV